MRSIRSALYTSYQWMQRKIFPTLRYSQYSYHDTLKTFIPEGARWLEIGCGHQLFANWMVKEEWELGQRARLLVGVDLDLDAMRKNPVIVNRICGNLENLPLANDSFDVVTANMVIEHLERPDAVLREVNRVLVMGGFFIFHTPNARSLIIRVAKHMPQWLKNTLARVHEGRNEEDVFPTKYRMNTITAIEEQSRRTGFHIEYFRSISGSTITAILGPLAIFELLYMRMLEAESLRGLRSNLIAVLKKQSRNGS